MGDAANLFLAVKPGFWDCGWMAPTVGFNRVGLPGGGLFFAAVVQGVSVADDFLVCGGVYRLVMVLENGRTPPHQGSIKPVHQ